MIQETTAVVMTTQMYVIRCGNHWLQCDQHRAFPEWVDLAHATLHTQTWCRDFLVASKDARGLICSIMPIQLALEQERNVALEHVKTRWLYAFEQECRKKLTGITSEGMWTNAHMYHGQGKTVAEAVDLFRMSLEKAKHDQWFEDH